MFRSVILKKTPNALPAVSQVDPFNAENFTKWLDQILRDPMISPATFRLAFALSRHCVDGKLRGTLTEIALLCGVSPPTARLALSRLLYRRRIHYRQNTRFALVTIRL